MTAGPSASEYRAQARRLIKQLRSLDAEKARRAAARFLILRSFETRSAEQLLADHGDVRLKHALAVVALENGDRSWIGLKVRAEGDRSLGLASDSVDDSTLMYEGGFDALLNAWFARYEDAREALERHGGVLFPFKRQFVVCQTEAIGLLSLDPQDPDWDRIGWDWVEPRDRQAWQRLREQRIAVVRNHLVHRPQTPGAKTNGEGTRT